MNNLGVLFAGELQRMKKYNILAASLFVAAIWIVVLQLTEIRNVTSIFPLLLYLDATSMAMLLIGVTMFFERQEGTIKTLLVSPISKSEYILGKTFSNIVSNIITLVLLYTYARVFKEININFFGLLGAVILISFFHSLVGFILTYRTRDFTSMLIGVMKYAFVLMLPVVFEQLGLITNETARKVFYLIPTKSAMVLLQAPAQGVEPWQVYLSVSYLLIASAALYYVVRKQFDDFAAKESGV